LRLPEFAGFATRDTTPARDAGLAVRALSETARDTVGWLRIANGPIIGLTADEESELLAAWHAQGSRDGKAIQPRSVPTDRF
jgi:hypothetical protein